MTARHIPIRAILALALVCGACASAPPSNDQVTASDLSSTSAQPHLGTTSTATAPSSTVGPLTTISTSRPTTAESEPDYTSRSGGCFDGPAWPGEYVDIPPAWTDSGEPPADLVDPDVDGDGSPDRIVIHENGDLQVDLGDAGWTSLLTAYTSYELADTADLDGDGDEELLLQRNGNNYGGIEVAYVSDCDLQLALSTERDDTAFYGNWCSSSSCAGTIKRTDCMLDGSGSFIRHHVMSVPDDQLDDWKSGMIAEATWNYTVTDHRLIDGVMTTEVVQETMQLSESEAFATMGNPGLGPDCRVR